MQNRPIRTSCDQTAYRLPVQFNRHGRQVWIAPHPLPVQGYLLPHWTHILPSYPPLGQPQGAL